MKSEGAKNKKSLGPQPWSIDCSVSNPRTSDPQPICTAECVNSG
ncbi:MAG: hypothetical protein ACW986_18960 [Promethearchaeota archaeon]